jgi:hypothetical protein
MTGPDVDKHSKKPRNVTIELEATNVEPSIEAAENAANEAVESGAIFGPADTVEPIISDPVLSASDAGAASVKASSGAGTLAKIGSGLLGGIVALVGAAGLQYAGKLPSFSQGASLVTLQAQVDKLSAIPAFDPAAIEGLAKGQTDLTSQVASISDAVAQIKATPIGDSAAAFEQKIAALEAQVASLSAGGAAGDGAALKALSDKVAALETAPQSSNGAGAVALAIAASGLKAAIDRGGSFVNEFETYATVAPASPDVEALRTLAAKGVPSKAELVSGYSDAANVMLSATRVTDPNLGLIAQLTESAKNLVKARPVGDIAGDTPEALLARMEIDLGRGDLEGMLNESAKLPDAAKTAGAAYLASIAARRDTDSLVTKALAAAITAAGAK